MRYLKSAWFWLYFPVITFGYYIFVAVAFLAWKISPLKAEDFSNFAHNCCVNWAKTILFMMPGWSRYCEGFENLPPPGEACVVVSNHESAADIWSIYTLGFQFRWLSKASIFKYPAIGPVMSWAGYIPIERGVKESHKLAMEQSSDWIKRGIPMLFFPEGSRSKTGELRPFKMGAFKLAVDNNVPVLPVALKGAKDLVPKGTSLPGRATVKVKVLPMLHQLDDEGVEAFAARAREIIKDALPDL